MPKPNNGMQILLEHLLLKIKEAGFGTDGSN